MDYSNNDFSGFIGAKVGIPAYNYQELEAVVTRLLSGESEISEEDIRQFIEERAHKINGKTAQRIQEQLLKYS